MKRKMVIVYKMGNSYVVKTYKKFTYTEIVKGLVAGLSSCTKGMNKIQAKFQLVEHDNTFSYWEIIKDER